jgi:hypothetical protein
MVGNVGSSVAAEDPTNQKSEMFGATRAAAWALSFHPCVRVSGVTQTWSPGTASRPDEALLAGIGTECSASRVVRAIVAGVVGGLPYARPPCGPYVGGSASPG